jgi:hypothetical protein
MSGLGGLVGNTPTHRWKDFPMEWLLQLPNQALGIKLIKFRSSTSIPPISFFWNAFHWRVDCSVSQSGFAKPAGTGPVRPVRGGTGPARYMTVRFPPLNRAYNFYLSVNRPVWPVYQPVFWSVGTGPPTVRLTLLPIISLQSNHHTGRIGWIIDLSQ